MSNTVELVPFEGRQIMAVRTQDGIFVVMKPVIELLGLEWSAQFRRIQRHPVVAKGVAITAIPSAGGMQEAVTLGLEQFHGWLVTLSTERIADEGRRAVIVRYQDRAFGVLFEHFHGRREQPGALPIATRIAAQNQILRLTSKLRAARQPAERHMIYTMLTGLCGEVGLPAPALDELGRDGADRSSELLPFWAALVELERRGIDFDHSRTSSVLAVNATELRLLVRDAGIPLRVDLSLGRLLRAAEPRFIAGKTVNSRITGTGIHCWVFHRDA